MSEQRIRAPELPDDLEWFNTPAPLKLADQRGKVVLLDFWTYCCINCMHVLPDLRYLEEKYRDGLTVIGLHSPKFPNEKVGDNVQKAINRYYIRHPVANDPSFQVWRQYGIRSWPSIIFIDPEGYVVGVLSGEGRRKQLDMLIREHLERAERKNIRNPTPTPVQLKPEPPSTLKFPGKVLATSGRLYISDSGHNRVIEATRSGVIQRVYGSTSAGFIDGNKQEAAFRNPQGLALVGDFLYVADTGNHAIRRISLRSGDVETVAGTGEQGRYSGFYFEQPNQAPLNSPWDLAYRDGSLYIAMAGQHQIWNLQLTTNTISAIAGSGREDIIDGDPNSSAFAQPSGLSVGESEIYVADSETSAIREIRLPSGRVNTLVGMGLFEFGDKDAVGRQARLQHPLGVAYDPARRAVWISDTYNSKIKKMSLVSNGISSIGCEDLQEPGGISLQGDSLWIANTNAHEIRRLDISTGLCQSVDIHD